MLSLLFFSCCSILGETLRTRIRIINKRITNAALTPLVLEVTDGLGLAVRVVLVSGQGVPHLGQREVPLELLVHI